MASAFGDPLAPSPCEQCGKATEGTMRCSSVQDSKNLCQGCFQDLPQARREDIGDPEWVCDNHLNHKVDFFCVTCQVGCCKECTVDVHRGHDVQNVLKLGADIRCDLIEHLQEVRMRTKKMSELQRKIDCSRGKIEEALELVNELKEEVKQNLEKEVHRINMETEAEMISINQKRRRDNTLKLMKEKADRDIQRIQETHHDLLKDVARKRCKLQKAKSKLMDGQQACKKADLEIESLLETTPEKLVCEGRQLGSLVKASLAFQCENDVLSCCREVEADLPESIRDVDLFVNCSRPLSPLVKFVLCILLLFCVVNEAGADSRDEYNRVLSSESMIRLVMLCSYFPLYNAMKCLEFMFTTYNDFRFDYQYHLTWTESFMETLKYFKKMFPSAAEFLLMTILFLILLFTSTIFLFQVKSVIATHVFVITILLSFSSMYQASPLLNYYKNK